MEENLEVIQEETKEVSETVVKSDNITDIDFSGTKIYGTPEQIQSMFEDYSGYFGEITNPKNIKVNPFHKSKYAPLDEVLNVTRPVLSQFGFALIQIPIRINGEVQINNILTHKSGAFITTQGLSVKPPKDDAQGVGATMTYLRRYMASSLLGISSEEDEDGNNPKGKKEIVKTNVAKTLPQLKAAIQEAYGKCSNQEEPKALITNILGKTVKSATEEDREKLEELLSEIEKIK